MSKAGTYTHLRFYVTIELDEAPRDPSGLARAMTWHGGVDPSVRGAVATFALDVTPSDGVEGSASRRAVSLLAAASHEAGIGTPRMRSLHISRSTEPPASGSAPVGVAEVAGMLGVSRQRVSQLSRSGSLPRPLAELASGPVWSASDIEAFLNAWDRRPGRRSS